MAKVSPTPLLSEKHSGVPARLYDKAQKAKSLIFNISTKVQDRRRRSPAIPQGIGKARFLEAIDELARQLGRENVEIVDQPLKDGWYGLALIRGTLLSELTPWIGIWNVSTD